MEDAYKIVAQKAEERKTKDKNRHGRGHCLGKLCVEDRVLVRNLSERRGTADETPSRVKDSGQKRLNRRPGEDRELL